MRRINNDALRLDLTENTPDSSSYLADSRLPNLIEHVQVVGRFGGSNPSGCLNSKLPNVVEGSMDYGSERRSSQYLAVDHDGGLAAAASQATSPKSILHQEVILPPIAGLSYMEESPTATYRSSLRKHAAAFDYDDLESRYDAARIYPEDGLSRFDHMVPRRVPIDRGYQESDVDAYQEQQRRRYSRELSEYEFRYAEDTLQLNNHHNPGIKTRENYDLAVSQQQLNYEAARYQPQQTGMGKVYGTLPRYSDQRERTVSFAPPSRGKIYDHHPQDHQLGGSRFEMTSTSPRYPEAPPSTSSVSGKVASSDGVSSTSGSYGRKSKAELRESDGGAVTAASATATTEKMNGFRKNNFEAYGLYSEQDDDHGFLPEKKTGPQYSYKGVVVNASGESSVVKETKRTKDAGQTAVSASLWCKPAVLLLLLILLVIIFFFVLGVFLYFNCK